MQETYTEMSAQKLEYFMSLKRNLEWEYEKHSQNSIGIAHAVLSNLQVKVEGWF